MAAPGNSATIKACGNAQHDQYRTSEWGFYLILLSVFSPRKVLPVDTCALS